MRTRFWLPALALALGLGVLVATSAAEAPKKADAERIAELIKQLGSDDFEERDKATKELEQIGGAAIEALRAASKEGEAEVKSRAASLLDKAEKKAATEKVLAPTKVKLKFKDTPLAEAVAEFAKQSGYAIQLHDPDKKLKDRKVTLDTGEVSFWEAFDKFCDKAGLVEATWQDMMVRPGGLPGGAPVPLPIRITPAPVNPPAPAAPPAEKKQGAARGAAAPVAARAAFAQAAAPAQVQVEVVQIGFGGAAGGGAVGGASIAVPIGGVWGGGGFSANVFNLKDGKPESVPTCYSGSVRIRALKEAPAGGIGIGLPPGLPGGAPPAKDDAYSVWLEVRPEPKVQLQNITAVKVEKAADDNDQKLEQLAPPAAPGFPGLPGGAVPPGGAALPPVARPVRMPIAYGMHGERIYQVRLKKGDKEAKALKEFAGAISAAVWAPAEPIITVEKITKAVGETAKGKDGGLIKVLEVKEEEIKRVVKVSQEDGEKVKTTEGKVEEEKITIKFEMEAPQNVMPANTGGQFGMMGGFPGGGIGIGGGVGGGVVPIKGVPVPPPPAPLPPATVPAKPAGAGLAFRAAAAPAAPAVAQIQIGVGGVAPAGAGGVAGPAVGPAFAPFPGTFINPAPGVTLVDDKGKAVALTAGAQTGYNFVPGGPGGGGVPKITYVQEYTLAKGQKPAKLLFSGSKSATVDVPFTFKDVPLK